jgi:hypothetical protein
MYSRNINNLFLTGRLISTSHVAFGSTRVMATCAHNGQAVAIAAALCVEKKMLPRDLLRPDRMRLLQQRLLRTGQHIPGIAASDEDDLVRRADITASSSLQLSELPSSGELVSTNKPHALLLPMPIGSVSSITVFLDSEKHTTARAELWRSSHGGDTTPDILLSVAEVEVQAGTAMPAEFKFDVSLEEPCHVFVIVLPLVDGALHLSRVQVPGVLALSQKMNSAVAKSPVQTPPEGSGVDTFAFWLPDRRPAARNLAVRISPPLDIYRPEMITNGFARPWCGVNAWAPNADDHAPTLHLTWPAPQTIRTIQVTFDTDFDHPMESVLMTHPERIMPGCITAFRVKTAEGQILAEVLENHQTRWHLELTPAVTTAGISFEILDHGPAIPAIFEVRCY